MNLLDTDVLVDCLRGTIPAQKWLKQPVQEPFAVPAVAAMELVMGCRDRADLERVQRFLMTFEVVWPEASVPQTEGVEYQPAILHAICGDPSSSVKRTGGLLGMTGMQPQIQKV